VDASKTSTFLFFFGEKKMKKISHFFKMSKIFRIFAFGNESKK